MATRAETLSVTDNRTGESYDVEIQDGTVKAMDFRQIKVAEDDFGLMTYDPAFTNTARCAARSATSTARPGCWSTAATRSRSCASAPRTSRWPTSIYGELPTQEQLDEWIFEITHHLRPREHQEVRRGLPLRRPSDGDAAGHGRSALHLLSRRQEHRRRDGAPHGGRPSDRQGADARRVRVPAQPRAALRLSGQRAVLPRQLPLDDVQDDRGAVRAGPAARARARRPLDPARGPRAELLDERRARRGLVRGGPVLGRGRRQRSAAAARRATRRCSGCSSGSSRRTTSRTSSG